MVPKKNKIQYFIQLSMKIDDQISDIIKNRICYICKQKSIKLRMIDKELKSFRCYCKKCCMNVAYKNGFLNNFILYYGKDYKNYFIIPPTKDKISLICEGKQARQFDYNEFDISKIDYYLLFL